MNVGTRREFLRDTALAAGTVMAASLAATATGARAKAAPGPVRPARDRPNIIFMLSDDLSYRDLACYGQKHIDTPNLDQLFAESMRFTQAYAGAAECAPTRCSLLTGKHMGHARIRLNRSVRGQDHLEAEDVTVAEVLKKAGYTTGFVGKWGIGTPGTAGVPYKKGFDFAFGYYDQRRAHTYYPEFLYRNAEKVPLPQNVGFDMRRAYRHTGDDKAHEYDAEGRFVPCGVTDPAKASYSEDLIVAEALQFIRASRDRPFFLYYATQLPHGPVVTPRLGPYRTRKGFPTLRHREWAAMVTHMDRSVGKIASLVKELGLDRNTVIFFAGDNGYSHWGYMARKRWLDDPFFRNKGPWRGGKFISTEGGLRVPMFVRWPGAVRPGTSDHVCAFWDFLPTAAHLAGARAPKETDGISIMPTLLGRPDEQKTHEYLYWENRHVQAARKGRYRAFRPHPSKPMEVYDIVTDIASTKDLAPGRPDLVTDFERLFSAARFDSKWYVNPGETKAQTDAKRDRARKAGQLIHLIAPNARSRQMPDE
jgi:arylsulfatase A-like enzyme